MGDNQKMDSGQKVAAGFFIFLLAFPIFLLVLIGLPKLLGNDSSQNKKTSYSTSSMYGENDISGAAYEYLNDSGNNCTINVYEFENLLKEAYKNGYYDALSEED